MGKSFFCTSARKEQKATAFAIRSSHDPVSLKKKLQRSLTLAQKNGEVVYDAVADLTWQQSASSNYGILKKDRRILNN